jgi:ribosomal protein S13
MRKRSVFMFAVVLAVTGLSGMSAMLTAECLSEAGVTEDQEVLELGHRVAAVRQAIQNPGAPHALQAITDLGHDQRYYVMVRGWLAYQRQGDLSIVAANQGQALEHIRARIRFLDLAIRAIDME